MNRTISGFVNDNLSFDGKIYGKFTDKKSGWTSGEYTFDDEDHFTRFIKVMRSQEKVTYRYTGFKDAEHTALWKLVENLNEV